DMERQIMLLRDAAVDTLVCTPSYAETLADAVESAGLVGRLPLRFAHLSGEFWSEERRERLEERLNIRAFYSCGVSPVVGHGLTGECAARCGLHVQEDHFVVECIDPETLEPVKDGEPGEVVVTALTIEASPIIRYRSGEIARLFHDKCECGRTTLRMSWARSHAAGGEL
ncbi:MAG: hypothetical protein PHI35_05215, partial [Victivallaceae bacterium]|nr:hypothetical protein [Victivallaceae bacterium]